MKRKRRLLVEGVDLGDGKKRTVWIILDPEKNTATVRAYRSPRRFCLSLPKAASRIAIAAQKEMI